MFISHKVGTRMNTFASRLTELRESRDMSQKDIQEFLHVSSGTASNYGKGRHEPDFDTLIAIADLFEVSTDYLLGRTDFKQMLADQPYTVDTTVSQALHLLLNISPTHRKTLIQIMRSLNDSTK